MANPAVVGIPWKRQLWHKWKASRSVPFRKSWFIGYDLEGNSYWELVDHNNPSRLRRKVSLDKPYFHFSDFKPHPMWQQWLQFTRDTAPNLEDLINDAKRRHRLRLLAEQADQKWKSLPLKSEQSSGTADPRIGSAWSGAAAEPAAESEPLQGWQDGVETSSENESAEAIMRKAMKEAENKGDKGVKVVRDKLGQVKVERKSPDQDQKQS